MHRVTFGSEPQCNLDEGLSSSIDFGSGFARDSNAAASRLTSLLAKTGGPISRPELFGRVEQLTSREDLPGRHALYQL